MIMSREVDETGPAKPSWGWSWRDGTNKILYIFLG